MRRGVWEGSEKGTQTGEEFEKDVRRRHKRERGSNNEEEKVGDNQISLTDWKREGAEVVL